MENKMEDFNVNTLVPINYSNTRVLTTEQLAEVYGCKQIQIQQNFKNNKNRFVVGKHYFKLEGETLKAFKNSLENIESVGIGLRAPSIILWTRQGASRHCKMLGTDKAWDMFDLLEESYFSNHLLPDFNNPAEAARAWADQYEKNQKLLAENTVMKPKAEYFDALVDRNCLMNFRDTAKELGQKQKQFINWLIDNKFVYRDENKKLKPYAGYMDYFSIKEYQHGEHTGSQTLITPHGREAFRLLLSKD